MNGIQPVNQRQQNLSDEKLFAHLKCEVLESMRQILTTSLMPDRHMDFLRSRHILSEEDCDEISHPPTRRKRASTFLNILGKKGAEAYDALCEALREEGTQTFLLRQLHEDFERRLLRYRELVEQQNQQQALHPISPPSLQPPSPSTPLHHAEHVSPGGATPPLSPSSASSLCGASCVSNTSGISMTTGQSREEEGVVSLQKPRLNVAQYLQSLTIREESPAVTSSESSTSSFQLISSSGSGFSQITSGASIDHLLPSFLSTRASHSSSKDSSTSFNQSGPSAAFSQPVPSAAFNQSLPSAAFNRAVPSAAFNQSGPSAAFNQSLPSAAFHQSGPSADFSLSGPPAAFTQAAFPTSDLPIPAQASKLAEAIGDHTIVRQHHQHQLLPSRGFPQEFGSSPLPEERGSTGLPPSPLPAMSRREPRENGDVAVESSWLQEPSFFNSLVGGSLAPPTPEAAHGKRPVLCDAALHDQRTALGKCAYSHDDAQMEREENNNATTKQNVSLTPKPYSKMLNTDDDFSSMLQCFAAANATVTKMKAVSNSSEVAAPSLSSPETPGACSLGGHTVWSSTAAAEPAQPEDVHSSSGVSAERKKGSHDVDPKDDGFEIVEGLSRESRNSMHIKDGHSPYSSRC